MTVKTASGSIYSFVSKDNKLYVHRGLFEGVVVSLSNIEVGQRLKIAYHSLDIYYNESSDISYIETNKIVSIT